MKKLILLLLLIIFLLLIIRIYPQKTESTISINKKTFSLFVAKSNIEKEKGLSILNQLDNNKGMIFIFEKEGFYPFWMKGMKFPLDIIYIKDDKIVEINKNLPFPKGNEDPAIIIPQQSANYVLEINAGLSDKYHFSKGDKVIIKIK